MDMQKSADAIARVV